MFGNVIFWKTKKQNTVTKFSTSAEYVALSEAVSEINVIRGILKSFNINLREPAKVYEDNTGALIIAKNGNFTKNSKHIEIQYHYINENYLNKTLDIIKIETENNVPDILTKALDKQKLIKFRKMLQVIITDTKLYTCKNTQMYGGVLDVYTFVFYILEFEHVAI